MFFTAPVIDKIPVGYFPDNDRFDACLAENDYDIVIFGVEEGINSLENKGCTEAPNKIRQQLYALKGFKNLKIRDLGNIKKGNTVRDTYCAVKTVVEEQTKAGKICVVLGGSQDITQSIYEGLQSNCNVLNVGVIDAKIDLGRNDRDVNSQSYIGELLAYKSLHRMEFVGYQSYFVPDSQLEFIRKRNHQAIRLGIVRNNMHDMEPVLRDIDLLSFDMNAIRQADAPGNAYANPNGLMAEEACQLSLFAGYSDRNKVFGIFELNPGFDINDQSAALGAQLIWHYLEGVSNRQQDYPVRPLETYHEYVVQHELIDENIVFYQNERNNRWWIEIPNISGKKEIYSCGFNEYKEARSGRIPDMWLRFYKK